MINYEKMTQVSQHIITKSIIAGKINLQKVSRRKAASSRHVSHVTARLLSVKSRHSLIVEPEAPKLVISSWLMLEILSSDAVYQLSETLARWKVMSDRLRLKLTNVSKSNAILA